MCNGCLVRGGGARRDVKQVTQQENTMVQTLAVSRPQGFLRYGSKNKDDQSTCGEGI